MYDLQEPFRWIADVTVMEAFESGALDLPDFYFTRDDYRYRFEPEAKERFLNLLRERFNSAVRYEGRALKWDTLIEQKAQELGRFLMGKSTSLNFSEPSHMLERNDIRELRARILALTSCQANQLGIGRSTLHNLRKSALRRSEFTIYSKTSEKLIRME